MNKPLAVFRELIGWIDSGAGVQARLGGVRHPSLGHEPAVTTSCVCRIEYDNDGAVREVETRNTIYLRSSGIPVESLGREHGDGTP